jgi:hypothetical protein
MKRVSIIFLALFILLSFGSLSAQPKPKWVDLGSRTVDWGADRDVIPVTGAKGSYNSIKLFVDKAPVEFVDIKIHFAKGNPQDVQIRKRIPKGGETRVIDINGKNRIIQKVTFWYKTSRPAPRGRAIVTLFGRK